MSVATYSVQVAWSGLLQGVFLLDSSALDGTAVLAGSFGNNTFDDLTALTKSVAIDRGRPSDLASMQQGHCTIKIKDPTGSYNPQNPSSLIAGSAVLMRPMRVRATFAGTTYGLFYGFTSRVEANPDPATQETMIEAVDLFEWLNGAKPVIATQTNQRVDQIIQTILNAIGWNDPAMASLQTGGDVIGSWADADGTKSCLTLIQNLLATDLGMFYIDGSGIAQYKNRAYLGSRRAAATTIDGTMAQIGLKGSADVKSIINGMTVTRTGGTAQTSTDATSRNTYGNRDGPAITSSNLASDAQALNVAQYLVLLQKTPRDPVRSVGLINQSDAVLTQQLTRELGDTVTVTEPRTGTSVTGTIQALTHAISDGGLIHRTTYTVQQPSQQVFTLDQSTLDGSDVLGY